MSPEIYLIVMGSICFTAFVTSWITNHKKVRKELNNATQPTITAEQMKEAERIIQTVQEKKEADYIATALLMPLDAVYNYLEENQFRTASPRTRIKIAKKLCKTYGVDEVVVLRRIREVYMVKKEQE